jgi:hypothetical protein
VSNVKACAFLREFVADKELSAGDKGEIRRARIEILRLSGALFAAIRQSLREQRVSEDELARTISKLHGAEIFFFDNHAKPTFGALLAANDDDFSAFSIELLRATPEERVSVIALRLLSHIESSRRRGYVNNRGAATMTNSTLSALRNVAQCLRACNIKVPYALAHLLNFILLIWLFSITSVIVVSFKYMTWLPLSILAVILYGLRGVANLLEQPFSWMRESNDLSNIGELLWNSCLGTHEKCAGSAEYAQSVATLKDLVGEERSRAAVRDAFNEAVETLTLGDGCKQGEKTNQSYAMPPNWTFPTQRIFRWTKLSFLIECFSFRAVS